MDYFKGRVVKLLVDYFGEDFRRITHALEVLKHAERIAQTTPGCDCQVLVACALLHDIGIKRSEELLGYNDGKTQEEYGPSVAEDLLGKIGFSQEKTAKVCQIIGNHHSVSRYDYPELAILKQADAIVNKLDRD
jgi:HD superfamily phosphodiesterase